nr:hypothetical protein [Polaromonas sp. AER18D-145]
MVESQKAAVKFFVPHQQFSEPVEPAMRQDGRTLDLDSGKRLAIRPRSGAEFVPLQLPQSATVGAAGHDEAVCVYHEEGFFGCVTVSSFRFGQGPVAQV